MTSPQFFRTPWRKSSRSGASGSECVEVAALWRRSSHSGSEGQECVEVAPLPREMESDRAVVMRDSKNPDGPVLAFAPDAWTTFLAATRTGTFDLTR